ncbi:MAG: DUF1214 domain-containing protein [Acidobacteriaceae bacterium]|nr:DUF1214 domain-containing protein [Acidobacteriaceae bacterium]MBV8571514.1 DUF1214 domain-containing protein [Acidobacteriaceae bacterium]
MTLSTRQLLWTGITTLWTGRSNYVVHFDKDFMSLPANGVRSLSAYRENFYVQNSIGRYGLPPGNPQYNPDGSLDIYLQVKSPGPDKESNWLPIPPSGMFNVTIRIYDPKPQALDPSCKFPPVKKVGLAATSSGATS